MALTVTAPVAQDLSAFLDTQAATQTVLLLLFVSMIVVGIAVILVASLTIAVRRADELTMLRARGGSLRQVASFLLIAAAALVTETRALRRRSVTGMLRAN